MSRNLESLIKNIDARKVLIIENDFTYIDDAEELLSRLCLIDQADLTEVIGKISYEGSNLNKNDIERFVDAVLNTDNSAKMEYLKAGKAGVFLDHFSKELTFSPSDIIDETRQILGESNGKMLMKYGVCGQIPEDYQEILDRVSQLENVSIRIFKDVTDDTKKEIKTELLGEATEGYFLFVVDKNLGGNESQGEDFIEEFIINTLIKQEKLNIVSVVYTTSMVEIQLPHHDKYFMYQISKGDPQRIEHLTNSLARCAYVNLFRQLKDVNKESYDYAFDFALKKSSNMIYLANMAHEEGITAFEAINKWFDLARREKLTNLLLDKEMNKFKNIINLSHYISEEFLVDGTSDFNFENSSSGMNVYEIFDYTINIQHLTPMPGDIFKWDKKYYVLVGQDCDFTVRKNKNKRETQVAELVEAKCITLNNYDKVDVDTHGKVIINYFKTEEGDLFALEINLNNRITCDFNVIDLCIINEKGNANIDTAKCLDVNVEALLPNAWKKYYEINLVEKFREVIRVDKVLSNEENNLVALSCNDISIFSYSKIDGDVVQFPLTRICRIRSEFRELVNKTYWDYRGRVGVNTINVDKNEVINCSKVLVGYVGQEKEELDIQFQGVLSKTNKRKTDLEKSQLPFEFNMKDINEALAGKFDLSELGETVNLDSKEITINEYKIEKYVDRNILIGVKITVPYRLNGHTKIAKSTVKITKILQKYASQIKVDTELYYLYGDCEQPISFLENGDVKTFSISEELSRGIKIPKLKIEIILNEGNIITQELVDEAAASIE